MPPVQDPLGDKLLVRILVALRPVPPVLPPGPDLLERITLQPTAFYKILAHLWCQANSVRGLPHKFRHIQTQEAKVFEADGRSRRSAGGELFSRTPFQNGLKRLAADRGSEKSAMCLWRKINRKKSIDTKNGSK